MIVLVLVLVLVLLDTARNEAVRGGSEYIYHLLEVSTGISTSVSQYSYAAAVSTYIVHILFIGIKYAVRLCIAS